LRDVVRRDFLDAFHRSATGRLFGLVETHKPFDDVRVRQAIAYAIPYEAISKDVLYGLSSPPRGVWPSASPWFDRRVRWPYSTNVDKARSLLSDAGYKKGFSFTCELSTGDANAEAEAIAVQSALKDVGISMSISKVAPAIFEEHLDKKSMTAWIQSEAGDYVANPFYHLLLWFTSKAVLNWFAYSNATIDKLTKAMSTELTRVKLMQLAARAQVILNETLPVIVLAEPHYVLAVNDRISGIVLEPNQLLRYNQLKVA
jgi:peptide/nickel transport system substrate-binding protein